MDSPRTDPVPNRMIANLRYAFRKLRRTPSFTVVAVLTLAVGIGSTAAIFAVVNGVLLRPLPYKDPGRLVSIWHTAPGLGIEKLNESPALHFTYASENHSFEGVGMWSRGTETVTGLDRPEQVRSVRLTYRTLPLLGVSPVVGRTFGREDDDPGAPETVILSYEYWQSHFGGDRSVTTRSLTVDGTTRQVVGVLPKGFRFMDADPDLYLPLRFTAAQIADGNLTWGFSYQGIARLRPGVTLAQADADVDRMLPMAAERYPGLARGVLEKGRFAGALRPLKQEVVGDTGSVLWVLLGTVSIILLIACANVANLFLVRAESRHREVAIRTALGAGRGRLIGQLLAESGVLGLLGGVLGLGLAWGGLRLLVALGPESLPRLHEIGVSGSVLAFTLGVSVMAAGLFGLFPALRHSRPALASTLKEAGRGSDAGRARHRARNILVVAQVALALVLLTGSGLMIRSFQALRRVDPGFHGPQRVLTFRVAVPEAQVKEPGRVVLTYEQILDRIRAVPGVASASLTSALPMGDLQNSQTLEVEGKPPAPDRMPPLRRQKWVGDGYPETMRMSVVAGRTITRADIDDRSRVAVVTEDLAREEWGSARAAVGQRVRSYGSQDAAPPPWYAVVGVVGDVRDDGVGKDPVPTVYWPEVAEGLQGAALYTPRAMAFVVRAAGGDPRVLLPGVRQAVWDVNPDLPLARVRTLYDVEAGSLARTSFTLVMLAIAAAVALFLGSVGIYGVISYVVAQRTREIGVRMALGAERADVSRMVLGQALVLAGAGVGIGLVAAAGLTRLMASLLYGVSPLDPLTFGAVAVALTAVALLASWVPARRAAGVDPVEALATEA